MPLTIYTTRDIKLYRRLTYVFFMMFCALAILAINAIFFGATIENLIVRGILAIAGVCGAVYFGFKFKNSIETTMGLQQFNADVPIVNLVLKVNYSDDSQLLDMPIGLLFPQVSGITPTTTARQINWTAAMVRAQAALYTSLAEKVKHYSAFRNRAFYQYNNEV